VTTQANRPEQVLHFANKNGFRHRSFSNRELRDNTVKQLDFGTNHHSPCAAMRNPMNWVFSQENRIKLMQKK